MALPSMSLETWACGDEFSALVEALMGTMEEGEDIFEELDRLLRGVEGNAKIVVLLKRVRKQQQMAQS